MAAKKQKQEKRVTVVVPRPDNITGDTETVVGVNGKLYQIQYNKPVEVPLSVAQVIQNNADMAVKITDLENTVKGAKAIAEF